MTAPATRACEYLRSCGVDLLVGVPDSLLASFVSEAEAAGDVEVVVTPNEGSAIGYAVGHYLGTSRTPAVFLQNSGLGNALNPLMSLCHEAVYGIPLLLVIGWRGENPADDEPQHRAQGPASMAILEAMNIPTWRLGEGMDVELVLGRALYAAREHSFPVAVLVSKGGLSGRHPSRANTQGMERRRVIEEVLRVAPSDAVIVGTTGKISRELNELAVARPDVSYFLSIGGMGHASMIGLGLAEAKPDRWIVCLDGDGAFQMHMGSPAMIGVRRPKRFVHVLLDNGVHESVGGHAVSAAGVDYVALARACGYATASRVASEPNLAASLLSVFKSDGPHLLSVDTAVGIEYSLSRPQGHPQEWKESFFDSLGNLAI